jgi:hypothetical protein
MGRGLSEAPSATFSHGEEGHRHKPALVADLLRAIELAREFGLTTVGATVDLGAYRKLSRECALAG